MKPRLLITTMFLLTATFLLLCFSFFANRYIRAGAPVAAGSADLFLNLAGFDLNIKSTTNEVNSEAELSSSFNKNSDTNNFQIEVTTTLSPQNFVVNFDSPDTLVVEWGDGDTNNYIYSGRATQTHTYSTAGIYTIKMSGHVHEIDFFIFPDPGTGTPQIITAVKTPIRGITGLTTANEMFKHGHNIPSFPQGLFDNCPGITSFYDVFLECSKVTSFPNNLFVRQTNVTSLYAVFDNCDKLTNIQPNVFFTHNVINLSWVFSKCYDLKSIPPGIFDYNTKNTTFAYAFFRCYDITSIPPNLFDNNTKVTTFANCFYECTNLTSIPPKLFDKDTLVTTYANCFYNCKNLTGPSPTNSAGKKLWELVPTPIGTGCFYNCINLSDYNSIPAGWK